MSALFDSIRKAGEDARLKFLRVLNRFSSSFLVAITMLNAAYPQALTQLGLPVPKWALIPASIAWFMLVEYAARRPKTDA